MLTKHSVTKNCSDLSLFEKICFSDLKNFANSWPWASNFKSFSRSLGQFFFTVGQNNFCNKILFFPHCNWQIHVHVLWLTNILLYKMVFHWHWFTQFWPLMEVVLKIFFENFDKDDERGKNWGTFWQPQPQPHD